MDYTVSQFISALPEIFLLSMACIILLVDAFLPPHRRIVTYILTQFTLAVALLLAIQQFGDYPNAILSFGGNYVLDDLGVTSKAFIFLFSIFAFLYAREYLDAHKISSGEYYLLGLLAVLGMSIMVSAYTFLTVYLGLELMSLSLYAMVAMNKNSALAAEAAMKYFILGSMASGILLYGISLAYGVTGSIQLNLVGQIFANRHDIVPVVALIFILSGLIFKFGAVPFHMWVPDVYQGAATPTTLFIASAPKIAAFAITVRILVQAMPSLHSQWTLILTVISILSMGLGNLLAIAQTDLKRMFAYSSIAHIGYVLLGVLAGPSSTLGYSAAMFYIATYVLVGAGGFAIIAILSRDGVEFDSLEDYRGLNTRNPWLAFMMLLLLFSMAGVPPTVGFFAKLGLLEALVQANMVWLAVVALLFALIGAYYYLRVVMLMYFEEPTQKMANIPIMVSSEMMVAISLNGISVLLLGLLPSFFIDICRISVG